MKRILACLALASIAVWVPGCQPEDFPLGSVKCPIINGEPDTSPEHMAVVFIYIVQGNMAAACTGTLIGPRVVLTAAHCVYGASADAVTVYFGNESIFGELRHVSEVSWLDSYNPRGYANDIAMLRLADDPPVGVEPIPFLPHSMGITSADIGTPLEFVGFGVTETGASGTKMTVRNNLDWVCTASGGCSLGGGVYAAANTICQDQRPGGPCTGDSGGPALIVRAASEYVCGITAYGDAESCQYYGCSTKVDEFEDFIYSFAGEPNGTPCSENADCLSNACADGVCCENACAGRCQGCNQPDHIGECISLPDGTPCPDSDVCNGEEVCFDGSCQGGQPLECHDDIDCTVDACDPNRGCVFQPLAADCDDEEICTRDICDPELGCVHEPLPDGLECAKNMLCLSGVCTKEPSQNEGCGCASTGTGALPMLLLFALLAIRATRRAVDRTA